MKRQNLLGDERLPLYQRLADSLREEIVYGTWRPGDRVSSENELALDYDLAVGTVRQALSSLVEEGLLERSHGRGTYVRRPNFDHSLFRFFRFRSPKSETAIPESRILKRSLQTAPGYIATKLEQDPDAKLIYISRHRLINNVPLLTEEIWLPSVRFKPLLDITIEDIGPLLYPFYASCCGQHIAYAQEELTAETADKKTARILQIKQLDPVIVIERIARGLDGVPLEWRRSRGNAAHFRYQTTIR